MTPLPQFHLYRIGNKLTISLYHSLNNLRRRQIQQWCDSYFTATWNLYKSRWTKILRWFTCSNYYCNFICQMSFRFVEITLHYINNSSFQLLYLFKFPIINLLARVSYTMIRKTIATSTFVLIINCFQRGWILITWCEIN